MDARLPKTDSATGRSLRTTVFSVLSAFLVFSSGLLTVIQGVPGCGEAVINYVQENALQLALLMGVPAGLFSFAWNFFRKDVRNY